VKVNLLSNITTAAIVYLLFILACPSHSYATEETMFPISEELKVRVEFWKKIYTEISIKEGLLHDDEDLSVIYQKIILPDWTTYRQQQRFIKEEKKKIASIFNSIVNKGGEGLTAEEDRIYTAAKRPPLRELYSYGRKIRFQLGQKEKFYTGLLKSQFYIDGIRSAFRARGLPEDLAFLPHVESSFNYEAYSKCGAAGIWQFIRSAARIYRLKMNYLMDERRDPLLATEAAVKMLASNFERLQSWPLAITAYNHGVNSMEKAIRHVGTRDYDTIVSNYRNRRFGFASKNFYPSFLAAREIASTPEKFFPGLTLTYTTPPSQTISLPRSLTMGHLSQLTNLSKTELSQHNPALRPVVFAKSLYIPSNYPLRLPADVKIDWDNVKHTAVAMAEPAEDMAAILVAPFPAPVAQATRSIFDPLPSRPPASVSSAPKNIPVKVVAVPAPELEIPFVPPPEGAQTEVPNIGEILSAMPTVPFVSQVAYATPSLYPMSLPLPLTMKYNLEAKKKAANLYQITVETDETLGHFSDWLVARIDKIRQLNGIYRNNIYVGQKIILPIADDKIDEFSEKRKLYHQAIEEDFYSNFRIVATQEHTIRRGETISKLVNDLDVPLWLIRRYMPEDWNENLRPGDKIIIPQVEAINQNAVPPSEDSSISANHRNLPDAII
jgi:membrane-bound lytic murein transglycosylase D